MKKKLTLAGCIVSAVTLIVFSIILIRGIYVIAQTGTNEEKSNIAFAIFDVIVMLITIVFDFITLPNASSDERLMEKKVIVSITIYGNAFLACLLLIDLLEASGLVFIIMSIAELGILTATILLLTDFLKARQNIAQASNSSNISADMLKDRLRGKKSGEEVLNETNGIEERLEMIESLKKDGLLTDEEYEDYRKKILNDELNK